jgi:hypothetical protein
VVLFIQRRRFSSQRSNKIMKTAISIHPDLMPDILTFLDSRTHGI